ncbi:hypothetical protein EPO56_01915 [Patescibacteria group bacterium]|nr:MAG: hypothetical protein EPO56_01915 [Patescibacteria group bacterium]
MPARVLMRFLLVGGDIILLLLAVPIALSIRILGVPSSADVVLHLVPFSILTILFILVFFSAGLYDSETAISRREVPGTIFVAQIVNMLLATVFFFFVPLFGITPKTTLFIYLLVSVAFVSAWHFWAPLIFGRSKARAMLIGDGTDFDEVAHEAKNGTCSFFIERTISVSGKNIDTITDEVEEALATQPDFIIMDIGSEETQSMFARLSNRVHFEGRFLNFAKVYEDLFRRITPRALSYRWLISNGKPEQFFYAIAKRFFDLLCGVILFVVFLVILPFVWAALFIEGSGKLFITQERMGKGGKKISVLKFRTMTNDEQGVWLGESENKVTKVGSFLRKTSLDELPQVLTVLRGDLSLIGPRSDIVALAERLADSIPFYTSRYTVTPGITGWAQVNQRYSPGNISPQSIEESRLRLAYDLYYVRHRSPLLDLSITLRTLKTLISRWIV